jgi:hypothetical protein
MRTFIRFIHSRRVGKILTVTPSTVASKTYPSGRLLGARTSTVFSVILFLFQFKYLIKRRKDTMDTHRRRE